jgi:hypothetical protein
MNIREEREERLEIARYARLVLDVAHLAREHGDALV